MDDNLVALANNCLSVFKPEINISWTCGTSQLSRTRDITSQFGELFISIFKGCGLSQGWYPDTNTNAAANDTGFAVQHGYLIQKPNPKGCFQCAIPMRHIYGFIDDYSKVTYGMRDTLHLIRKDDKAK